jgi:Transposase and inactivated derivatives
MNLPERKRNRLADYDYSENGAYFVTICTQNRVCCLSEIIAEGTEATLTLTRAGQIVDFYIREIPNKYPTVSVDHAVVMPNHVHLLIMIHRNGGTGNPSPTARAGIGGTGNPSPTACAGIGGTGNPSPTARAGIDRTGDPSPTLGNVIGWFKYQTTKAINTGLKRQPCQFWQRSYYDHVIRDENDYLNRWNYIDGNPSRWAEDEYNKQED